jgi:acyl-CoA thioester hydrolase
MTPTITDLLADYPVVSTFPIHWGDMDAYQHVNNIQYFKYWETARIEYFNAMGLIEETAESGIGPILASTSCVYRFPLVYPDTVSVGCRTVEIKEDRFVMNYIIVSHRAEKVAARGEGVVVAYNYQTLQKAALPPAMRAAIERLEQRAGRE